VASIEERAAHLEKIEKEVHAWEKENAKSAGAALQKRGAEIAQELLAAHRGEEFLAIEIPDADGSLLQAKMSALRNTPFGDWRIPGALLAILVGGGLLVTAASHLVGWRHANALAVLAGIGLVAFEAVELAWLGYQPLEVVFAFVGMVIATLAWMSNGSAAPAV